MENVESVQEQLNEVHVPEPLCSSYERPNVQAFVSSVPSQFNLKPQVGTRNTQVVEMLPGSQWLRKQGELFYSAYQGIPSTNELHDGTPYGDTFWNVKS